MSHYLNPPSLLRVPDAQRASSSSTSISSASSFNSTGFEQPSRDSQFTDSTPLMTPLDSVDSIFGDDPQLQTHPRFSDPIVWEGLTDQQWKLHVLVSKAECAIKEAEEGVLDKGVLQKYHDDLYDQTDDEFDAVAAVRARLMKSQPTITIQRALEIIERRSRAGDMGGEHSMTRRVGVEVAEEIEDYAEDFELGDEGVLEIPATPKNRELVDSRDRESALDTIEETDEDLDFPEWHREDVPPTPMIRPVDPDWDCPSFSTSDTSFSTADSVSQLIISPLVLDNPKISSPVIFHEGFDPIFGSPIVSVSSFLFRSRRPLPTSLLDENLDIAAVMQLEIGASLRNSVHHDATPRANPDTALWGQHIGLGLMDVSTPQDPSNSNHPVVKFQGNYDCRPETMEAATNENVSMNSLQIALGSPGAVRNESVPPFEPAQSSWDVLLQELGGLTSSTTGTEILEGLDNSDPQESLSFTGHESLESYTSQVQRKTGASVGEIIRPYVPRELPTTLAYTEFESHLNTVAPTVTAGSNHPAASAEYINPAVVPVALKVKGLGLRLPSGLQRSLKRHSSCLPRSERCHDLAGLASQRIVNDRPGRFRRRKLSSIPEMVSPQPVPTGYDSAFSLLPASTKGGSLPSPTIRKHASSRLFNRALKFLF